MPTRTIALAALLMAGGIGTTIAQMPPGAPAVLPPGHPDVPGAVTPLYRQQVPAVVPLKPHIDEPSINPSAAGTLMPWENNAADRTDSQRTGGYGGSVGVNANTHPFKALRAGGEPREEGMTVPATPYPVPRSTMNRQDGR